MYINIHDRLNNKYYLKVGKISKFHPKSYASYVLPDTFHKFPNYESTLLMDLRNDGSGRKLIPFTDKKLNIRYNLIYLSKRKYKEGYLNELFTALAYLISGTGRRVLHPDS